MSAVHAELALEVSARSQVCDAVRYVAAREIMPHFLKVARHRKADGSLCTEADLAAQDALTMALRSIEALPVVGEEMTEAEQCAQWNAGSAGLWCIDPLDGTSNFVNGLPLFSVSVALMRGGLPVLGVVYDPVADEMFHAESGQGAWLGTRRLTVNDKPPRLRSAIANVDFKRLSPRLSAELVSAPPYVSQRNLGSGTLEWCYLAAGRFDLCLHGGQKLWDYAAGSLILAEAGGRACTLDSDLFFSGDLWKRPVIASHHPELLGPWRDWVRSHR